MRRPLRLTGGGKAPLQRPTRGREPTRVAHGEAIQEDQGVARPRVRHTLELERIQPFSQHSRLELEIQARRPFPVPPRLSHVGPVHPHPDVMVHHLLEVARALQGDGNVRGTGRRHAIGREGVALPFGRDEQVPEPQVWRLQEPRLVIVVLLPANGLVVRVHGSARRRGRIHGHERSRSTRLQLVDRVSVGVQLGPLAQEIQGRARRETGAIGLDVEGHVFPLPGQAQLRSRRPGRPVGEDVFEGHRVEPALLHHELSPEPPPGSPGSSHGSAPSRAPQRPLRRFRPRKVETHHETTREDEPAPVPAQREEEHLRLLGVSLERRSEQMCRLRREYSVESPPFPALLLGRPNRSALVHLDPGGALRRGAQAQGSGARPMSSRKPGAPSSPRSPPPGPAGSEARALPPRSRSQSREWTSAPVRRPWAPPRSPGSAAPAERARCPARSPAARPPRDRRRWSSPAPRPSSRTSERRRRDRAAPSVPVVSTSSSW